MKFNNRQAVDPAMVGRRVRIIAVAFPRHGDMVGRTGTIRKAIKSRNLYDIALDGSGRWQAFPWNVAAES